LLQCSVGALLFSPCTSLVANDNHSSVATDPLRYSVAEGKRGEVWAVGAAFAQTDLSVHIAPSLISGKPSLSFC
jgi:hypothetical protein